MATKNLLLQVIRKFISKDTLSLGAALAFYTAFSLAPLLLLALAIAGFVLGDEAASGRLSVELSNNVGPEVAEAIQQMLIAARSSGSNSTATAIGIGALLFGAAGVFGQLQSSLNSIWEVPSRTEGGIWFWVKTRFLSYAMVLGTGFLLLVSLIISTFVTSISSYLLPNQAFLTHAVNNLLSFGTVTLLFALIFKMLPDCIVSWRDVWIGAAFTAGLFTLGKYLLGLYLVKSGFASGYGAAGSLAVVLIWVYYASQILLFGAQFTQVYAQRRLGRAQLAGRTAVEPAEETAK